jgi:hypothetical protein
MFYLVFFEIGEIMINFKYYSYVLFSFFEIGGIMINFKYYSYLLFIELGFGDING